MNHRSILETILATSGVDEEKQLAVLVALDKYDNIGIGGLAQEIEKIGITSESWKEFVKPIHQFTNIELELSVSQSNEIHPELNSRMLNFIANFVGYGSAQQP